MEHACIAIGFGYNEEIFKGLFDISVDIMCRANKAYDLFLFFQFVMTFESCSLENGADGRAASAVSLSGQELCKSDITIDF